MKKLLIFLSIIIGLLSQANATSQSILPKVQKTDTFTPGNYNCTLMMKRFNDLHENFIKKDPDVAYNSIKRFYCALELYNGNDFTKPLPAEEKECKKNTEINVDSFVYNTNDILGCALITGRIKLYMYKMYILYFIRLLTLLSGSLSILFVIIGGYKYFLGALQNDVGEAKTTITNALFGLAISTAALIIVNLIQTFVSS